MPLIAIVVAIVVVAGITAFALFSGDTAREPETATEITATQERDDDTDSQPRGIPLSSGDDKDDDAETEVPVAQPPAAVADEEDEDEDENDEVVSAPVPDPEPVAEVRSTYEDGSYTESLAYTVPGGHSDPMTVTLTLDGDIVTAASVSFDPTNNTSKNYQSRFSGAYKSQVVGKDLDSISLSRVGGASLTSTAFNKAVVAIKADAR